MRFVLKLAFNGSAYHGWQRQKNAHSVQEEIEKALEVILGESAGITGCGRTDTGVHAMTYYAHFDRETAPEPRLVYQLNAILPRDIALHFCREVSEDFHARFSAISREYRYFIHTHKNPFLQDRSWFIHHTPGLELMNKACDILKQYEDFASFCKKGADNKTTLCRIDDCHWAMEGDQWVFTIRADRFLRNMVRAIVGTLVDVGLEKLSLQEFARIVEARNRNLSGESVPACGLYLWDVRYPDTLLPPIG